VVLLQLSEEQEGAVQLIARSIYAVACLGIAGCTAHLVYWFLTKPTELSRWGEERTQGRDTFLRGAYFVAAFIGIAVAVSGGIESALAWMPRSWVNFDEDGNSEWVASSVARTIAVMVTLLGMAKAGEMVRRIRNLEDRLKENASN
jgi:hypothetical protein